MYLNVVTAVGDEFEITATFDNENIAYASTF